MNMPPMAYLAMLLICTSSLSFHRTECARERGRRVTVGTPSPAARHFLAVAAILKNEAHIIREWCLHYIDEGFDHIFLIDNGSTDNYLPQIEDLIKAERVTLLVDPTRYDQDAIYARQLTVYLSTCTWMAILDLDEFLYGRNTTIAAYLRGLTDDIGAVRLAWKQFGSSGLIKQPENVVQSFTERAPWMNDNINIKSIFLSSAVARLQMHATEINHLYRSVSPLQSPSPVGIEHGEAALQEHVLHLNHYQLQSREWFLKVKSTRGSATTPDENALRDKTYFEAADLAYKGIIDEELKLKKPRRTQ